ncbi:hypothetical protein FRIGORI9N_70064 [Frigoribacterium sp. 9N]|nr:hypothetical protein FRIGORI9N_70064 [Frigoribacterium sp. 9N]
MSETTTSVSQRHSSSTWSWRTIDYTAGGMTGPSGGGATLTSSAFAKSFHPMKKTTPTTSRNALTPTPSQTPAGGPANLKGSKPGAERSPSATPGLRDGPTFRNLLRNETE